MRKKPIILFLALSAVFTLKSFGAPINHDKRIRLLSVITELPDTGMETLEVSFSKKSIPWWAAIAGSTTVLYHYDLDILKKVQEDGRRMGIGNEENTRTVLEVGPYPILRLPSDTGSTMYFLGDGWTHTTIAAGFFLNGWATGNNRPYNTGLQLIHAMGISTFFNQFLKRTTGRESPSQRTSERGTWRPFPNPIEYGKHTSSYDAFPSGHVMTATVTFTVISANYPEYNMFIIPLGAAWVGTLGWQMMNNGVHWASDYPLAIGMGIVMGHMATHLGQDRKKLAEEQKEEKTSWMFYPSVDAYSDTPTFNALYTF